MQYSKSELNALMRDKISNLATANFPLTQEEILKMTAAEMAHIVLDMDRAYRREGIYNLFLNAVEFGKTIK